MQQLARMDLIKVNSLDSIAIPHPKATVIWDDFGPIGKVFSKAMLKEITENTLRQFESPTPPFLALWGRQLSADNLEELKQDFKVLEDKYRKISDYNGRIYIREQLMPVSSAFIIDLQDSEVFSRIVEL